MPDINIVVNNVKDLSKELQEALARTNNMVVKLLRPQDLLSLEFRFSNFLYQPDGSMRKLVEPALMMVSFPEQSISEGSLMEDTTGGKVSQLPVNTLCSGRSYLVFKINKDLLKLNAQELLDWSSYEPVVSDRAVLDGTLFTVPLKSFGMSKMAAGDKTFSLQNIRGISKQQKNLLKGNILLPLDKISTGPLIGGRITLKPGVVAQPAEWETVLEIPRSIYISPTKYARWKHQIALKKNDPVLLPANKLYELWHTRMGIPTTQGIDDTDLTYEERQLRVLWAEGVQDNPDNVPPGDKKGSDVILKNSPWNNQHRHKLVHETSNFRIKDFIPRPVRAKQLFLTSLGAYLDSLFLLDKPAGNLDLLKWAHLQTLGRTHYVELVSAGYVAPLGHKAVMVEITERKPYIEPFDKLQKPNAVNLKRSFLLISEPVKYYDRHDSKGNWFPTPFSKIEILTTATPLLDAAKSGYVFKFNDPTKPNFLSPDKHLDIIVEGKRFIFKMQAQDVEGNDVVFEMPLIFVSNEAVNRAEFIMELASRYNFDGQMQIVAIKNQQLALAPELPNNAGAGTAFPTDQLIIDIKDISNGAQFDNNDEPQHFLPIVRKLTIKEPTYERLTGDSTGFVVQLEDDAAIDNKGGVFAIPLTLKVMDFGGNADKTGGFVLPNFIVSAFTKAEGAVSGNFEKVKQGVNTAQDYFSMLGDLKAKLFGVFELGKILSTFDGGQLPQMFKKELPDSNTYKYNLNASLQDPGLPLVELVPKGSKLSSLTTVTIFKKNPTAPVFEINTGIRTPFDISLLKGLITVKFKKVEFIASAGKSADINIDLDNPALVFGGPLAFVNELQKFIPADGFSDPPYLDVSTTGVKCGYSLAIPNIQLGAFTLSNVSLGADVNLPFTGAPMSLGFRFCQKQQPFTLTVAILGGGGYFGFEIDLNGLRSIDAAIEFGAAVALNLGVAKGAVSIMAGIYFKMVLENGSNTTQLTGYLRINGAMSIIGLITAAVELYMAFTYLTEGNKVYGEATVKIKVHVLFFSKTVSVRTSRTFSGNGNDPNFQQTYSEQSWLDYCEAFAA